MSRLAFIILLLIPAHLRSQIVLEADGPGNTYELITNVLAPGNGEGAVENPECIHPEFGRHIAEVWDADLSQYVFEFYSHVTPDNDRCIAFDRQRIEIKTYDPSPDNLKGILGETVTYKWKFKLPVGYKPSSNFTHIHQIKAVGGDDGMPIFTLTPRKGSPNKMELIHNNVTKVSVVALSLFEGVWVECTEVVTIGAAGTYSMLIKRVDNGSIILSYSNTNIMTIRPDNNFIRPKWGIYRSLADSANLRDEAMRFASFSIQEGTTSVDGTGTTPPEHFSLEQNYPNPFNPETAIGYWLVVGGEVNLRVYDLLGCEVAVLVNEIQVPGMHSIRFDASKLQSGTYFYTLQSGEFRETKRMILLR